MRTDSSDVITSYSIHYTKLYEQMNAIAVKKVNLRSQIDVLKQQLKNAKITQERVHKLFSDKAATQQQVDDIDGQVRVLEQQIQSQSYNFV